MKPSNTPNDEEALKAAQNVVQLGTWLEHEVRAMASFVLQHYGKSPAEYAASDEADAAFKARITAEWPDIYRALSAQSAIVPTRDEINELIRWHQWGAPLCAKMDDFGGERYHQQRAEAWRQFRDRSPGSTTTNAATLPKDQFARTLKVNSIIEAAWARDAQRLALALMSEPATSQEIADSTEIVEVRDALRGADRTGEPK